MADLTGPELKAKIAAILKEADLETTSAKKVRMQLEEDLKADLTSRKEEIGKLIQVHHFLNNLISKLITVWIVISQFCHAWATKCNSD